MKRAYIHGWPGLWIARHIGAEERAFDPCSGFLVHEGVQTVGAIAFHDFRMLPGGNTIHMSAAATSPRWLTRGLMRDCAEYAFDHLGCVRVEARIRSSAENLEDLLVRRLGFRYEGTARCAYDGSEDAIILSMLRHELPGWLKWDGSAEEEATRDSAESRPPEESRPIP